MCHKCDAWARTLACSYFACQNCGLYFIKMFMGIDSHDDRDNLRDDGEPPFTQGKGVVFTCTKFNPTLLALAVPGSLERKREEEFYGFSQL